MFLDSNIHVNNPDNKAAIQFIEMCDGVGLQQHIKQETHISGNTLDLLLNECGKSEMICDVQTLPYLSNHCVVLITPEYTKSMVTAKKVKFQNRKRVCLEPLTEAVEKS